MHVRTEAKAKDPPDIRTLKFGPDTTLHSGVEELHKHKTFFSLQTKRGGIVCVHDIDWERTKIWVWHIHRTL